MGLVPTGTKLAFNGGTITGDLEIAGQTDAVELKLVPVANQNNNVLETQDGGGATVFVIDADGNIVTGQIDAQPGLDIRAFRATGPAGGTADVADFVTGASATVFRITNAGNIGFFAHTPGPQPALTSGSATPAQIAVALQSLGLASGT
jgi:hypothetical protein